MNAVTWNFVTAMESGNAAIVLGLKQRDPELLNLLIEQYQRRLLRYLVSLCGNLHLAEDLSQDTWMRVVERGHQYDGRHEFSTWLFQIGRNLSIDHFRRKSAVSLDALREEETTALAEPADPSPLAWEALAQHEQAEWISTALGALPPDFREVVVLRFQEDLRLEEIARVTGLPLGTVKSRLHRGLAALLEQLKGMQP